MRLLLDTHVILWWLTDDPTLATDIKAKLDTEPDIFLSAATSWELAIKYAVGKLKAPEDLLERVRNSGFHEMPVTIAHTIVAGRLPLLHKDPFDRMLIAQARHENLTLVTRDPEIRRYEVALLPV